MGRAAEYIQWPGAETFPSEGAFPGWDRDAPGNPTVHSHGRWEWTEVTGEEASQIDAAVNLAQQVSPFVKVKTTQLEVTDTAWINDLVVHQVWARVVRGQEGEFEKLKAYQVEATRVVADEVKAGAVDGMVITGATFQTSKDANNRILIDSSRMSVTANGVETLRIDARTGNVFLRGQVGIEDDWSYAEFTDLNDWGGFKYGVGLHFQRKGSPYRYDGRISITETGNGEPGLFIHAPSRNRADGPRIYLTERMIDIIGNGNGDRGQSARLWINDNDIGIFTKSGAGVQMSGGDSFNIFVRNNDSDFKITRTSFRLRAAWNNDLAIWASAGQLLVGGDKNHYFQFVQNSATELHGDINVRGSFWAQNKNFVARHPLDPENRILLHSATESPWDGIEYWGTIVLDDEGCGEAVLPDYVPRLHRRGAPVSVQLTSSKGVANTPGWDRESLSIPITGEPGATVQWLLKAARVVDGSLVGHTVPEPDMAADETAQRFLESMWGVRTYQGEDQTAKTTGRSPGDNPVLYGTL